MPLITLTNNSYYESNMNNAVREYRGMGKWGVGGGGG